jgi:hypothetical protein
MFAIALAALRHSDVAGAKRFADMIQQSSLRQSAEQSIASERATTAKTPTQFTNINEVIKKRVDSWSKLEDGELDNSLFHDDLASYVKIVSARSTPGEILMGLTYAINEYSDELRKLRTFDPDKANDGGG